MHGVYICIRMHAACLMHERARVSHHLKAVSFRFNGSKEMERICLSKVSIFRGKLNKFYFFAFFRPDIQRKRKLNEIAMLNKKTKLKR